MEREIDLADSQAKYSKYCRGGHRIKRCEHRKLSISQSSFNLDCDVQVLYFEGRRFMAKVVTRSNM